MAEAAPLGSLQSIPDITATIELLARLAYVDERTGLENRNALKQEMQSFAESPHAVMFVDLAGFKEINDRHSHEAGDAALRHVGSVLLTLAREQGAKAYRYGGDEFVAVVPTARADDFAGAAIAALTAMTFTFETHALTVGATLGFCVPSAPEHIDLLIKRAEKACAVGKYEGVGGVTRWAPALQSIELASNRKRSDACKATTTVVHRVEAASLQTPRACGSCGLAFTPASEAPDTCTARAARRLRELPRRLRRAARAAAAAFSERAIGVDEG